MNINFYGPVSITNTPRGETEIKLTPPSDESSREPE